MKSTTTTMEASKEGRRHVLGIKDKDRGGSGSTTGSVDWKRQRSVDFPCHCAANRNTVLSLSRRCLILILFHQIPFFS